MTAEGAVVAAIRIATAVQRPQDDDQLVLVEDWVSQHGSVAASIDHHIRIQEDGREWLHADFTDADNPYLLYASVLWGQTLSAGWRHELTGVNYPDLPGSKLKPETTKFLVQSTSGSAQDCRVRFEVTYSIGENARTRIVTTIVQDSTPLPLHYEVRTDQASQATWVQGAPQFVMQRREWVSGTGFAMPGFTPRQLHEGLSVGPADNGFLAETTGTFPTNWMDAVTAIEEDPTVSVWLSEHPDSSISEVYHSLGAPSTNIIDEWSVKYWSGSQDLGLVASVQQRAPGVVPLLDQQYVVSSQEVTGVTAPLTEGDRVRLSEFSAVFARHSGNAPEVIQCLFWADLCSIGTHAGTNKPRVGETGGSAGVRSGVVVDIRSGFIYQEAGLGPILTN